jgi:hypothetical protein
MRKSLHIACLLAGTFFIATPAFSQNDRFAFAVTDLQQNGSAWNALRKLDLKTGEYSTVLLNGSDASLSVLDAAAKKIYNPVADARYGNYLQPPFGTGVAAMAYDKRNNRIYFTPMFIDQLRYIDLKTMKLYYVTDQSFTRLGNMHNDEGKIVTRMAIAPDGNGYAVTNDGNTFVQFTTGKKLKITQLGSLVDDPDNTMSIKSRCSSWGGDMVADDDGNLYIFSARKTVYKVNIETKVAALLPPVTGLPNEFTINGAVVDDNNRILVSSAVYGQSWFTIDVKTMQATAYKTANGVYRSSDLANSNYLQTKPQNTSPEIVTRRLPDNIIIDKVMIYPNPVVNNQFAIQFGKIPAGNYDVELTDVMGRVVLRRTVNVTSEDQSETIDLKSTAARGVYLVKVMDISSKSLLTQKLVVQ